MVPRDLWSAVAVLVAQRAPIVVIVRQGMDLHWTQVIYYIYATIHL